MNTDVRRTIEELAARYELEPTLRDVYVEGAFDATVIGWVLREARCHNAAVYGIDTVNIPVAISSRYGLAEGSKGRIVRALHGTRATRRQPEPSYWRC